MKKIRITYSNGVVTFETVFIDTTENVFFTNEDTTQAHWPTISTNQVGPAPSPNSSQCTVPLPSNEPPSEKPYYYEFKYGCQIAGHQNEVGIIRVFNPLAAGTTTLPPATLGNPIDPVQVVTGGMSPYATSGEVYQVTDSTGTIIQQGSGSIGPGLLLDLSSDNGGITVTGAPTVQGTYNFTFIVNDAMGANLQQVQYSMVVT
jgi:hypothetical protein